MRRFYRLVPREFWLGMLTLAGVITLDVLPGLIIGVVCCILLVVYRNSRLPLSVLGPDPAVPGAYVDLHRHPEAEPTPGVLILRPDGTLYYVNAQSILDTVESMVASSQHPVHTVVIDLDANDELDITSSEKLVKLVHDLRSQRIRVGFAHLHAPALTIARHAGVFDELDAAPIFETVAQAVAWAALVSPAAPRRNRAPRSRLTAIQAWPIPRPDLLVGAAVADRRAPALARSSTTGEPETRNEPPVLPRG